MLGSCPICLESSKPFYMLPCTHGLCKGCLLACGWDDPEPQAATIAVPTPSRGAKRPREESRVSRNVRQNVGSQATGQPQGIWILTKSDDTGTLWHANLEREVKKYSGYPLGATSIAADGLGGVWILTKSNNTGALWHASLRAEVHKYSGYPLDCTQIAGDGQGGVWILTKSEDTGALWHANMRREIKKYSGYPLDATKITGDGQGGVWILTRSDRSDDTGTLWHANFWQEVEKYQGYPLAYTTIAAS